MVHNLLIISWAFVFSSCASIKEKSAPVETSFSGIRAITDKTILYWKLSLDNVAMGRNKNNEIDKINYKFDKHIRSNIGRIHSGLTASCSDKDLLLLDNLLNVSLELVRNNDSKKIGETFTTLTKDIRQSCKETWFNWFVACEDTMKNLINIDSCNLFRNNCSKIGDGPYPLIGYAADRAPNTQKSSQAI